MSHPYIARLLDCAIGETLFGAAPKPEPDRMCARLAARFGAMDLDLLRRMVARESEAALRLANETTH